MRFNTSLLFLFLILTQLSKTLLPRYTLTSLIVGLVLKREITVRYCVEGFGLGDTFDCLLLCFDDAADKRYKLMNQVIKARVSGRRAFESLFSDNAPLPRQTRL